MLCDLSSSNVYDSQRLQEAGHDPISKAFWKSKK